MTESATGFGPWIQTRNTLFENLGLNADELARKRLLGGSAGEKKALKTNVDGLNEKIAVHAINGLKQVDAAIATSDVREKLSKRSKAARVETDRLKNTTKSINELTALVNELTGLVAGIGTILK